MKLIATASLLTVAVLAGCASTGPTPETNAIAANFARACTDAQGQNVAPTAQGSYGTCKKGDVVADLYINRDFLMVGRQGSQDLLGVASSIIGKTCRPDGGTFEGSLSARGGRFVQHPDGLEKCTANDNTWILSTSAPADASTGKRQGHYSAFVRRGPSGAYDDRRLQWAVARVTQASAD